MSLIQAYGIPSEDWGDPIGKCWLTWVEISFAGQELKRISMRSNDQISANADWEFLAENYGFNKHATSEQPQ
jgi:hypothetical protein